MNSAIHWLREHRIVALILAVVYSSAVIGSHDLVQTPALALQEIVGMAVWHYSILGLIVSAMIWLFVSIAESHGILDRLMDNKAPLSVLIAISLLATTLLMVNSVEHIHCVQYIILDLP